MEKDRLRFPRRNPLPAAARQATPTQIAGPAPNPAAENPLAHGCSREVVSENIKTMIDEGRPQNQAVAIALSNARKDGCEVPKGHSGSPRPRRRRNPVYTISPEAEEKSLHVTNPEGHEIYFANNDFTPPGHPEKGLWVLWFGAYGSTRVAAFASSLGDALDTIADDWIEKYAPGIFSTESVQEEYKRLIAEGKSEEEADEESIVDETPAGGYGHYIPSWEWGIVYDPHTAPAGLYLAAAQAYEREYGEAPYGLKEVTAKGVRKAVRGR